MVMPQANNREKAKKGQVKLAIALAMQGRWEEAVATNLSILSGYPRDQEANNRLGKALTELGRTREAREAFQRALELSPHNAIAKKNLERLLRLGDDAPRSGAPGESPQHAFIEERGRAGVTSLVNLASPNVLLKLAPGHPLRISLEGGGLNVTDRSGEYVGTVEPKLASRLAKLTNGGNRYEAAVTSVGERELTVIIREVYKHPSQAGTVSFPSRAGSDYRVQQPASILGYELSDEAARDRESVTVKDWSDDDTEPGDDDAYSPVVHRIINAGSGSSEDGDDF